MAPKLTETTNDKFANGGTPIPIVPRHIDAPHEPTREGEMPAFMPTTTPWPPTAFLTQNTETPQPIITTHTIPEPKPDPVPLKIALVGTAPSSRNLAPFNDPTWKIWVCSAGNMNQVPRVDAWFEIHSNLLWPEHIHFGGPYIEWLKQQTFPVYMQDTSLVPRATPLPLHDLLEEFGDGFFTSSFAWMLAMAIKAGASEIALYGIDMASRDEYILQRPAAYFFFWEARRRGIKVTAPHESDIMRSPGLYGFSDGTPFGRKMAVRDKELRDRVNGMRQQRDQLSNSIVYLEGAIEDVDYIRNIWSGLDRTNL